MSFFLIFTLANIGMPGTINFVGEFLVLLGIFKVNTLVCFFASTSMVLGAIYSIWLYNRLFFGKVDNTSLILFKDLTRREFNLFLPLILFTIIFGISPSLILNSFTLSVNNYLILF